MYATVLQAARKLLTKVNDIANFFLRREPISDQLNEVQVGFYSYANTADRLYKL